MTVENDLVLLVQQEQQLAFERFDEDVAFEAVSTEQLGQPVQSAAPDEHRVDAAFTADFEANGVHRERLA